MDNNANESGRFNKTGKVNLDGLDIDLSVILGEKIAEEYYHHITEEQLQCIFNYMTEDIWRLEPTYYQDEKMPKEVYRLKYHKSSNYYDTKDEPPKIASYAKKQLDEKIKIDVINKIEEIISTEDYSKKVEEIAQSIIDYVTTGWQEEMKNRIMMKLISDNVEGGQYTYMGLNLKEIIHQEVGSILNNMGNHYN